MRNDQRARSVAEHRTADAARSSLDINHSSRTLLYTVYFIYFFCGMALCFEGAFNPELKEFYHLDYQQQQYTMFAKNIPFALAIVIGVFIPRLGYKNCLTIAMALFAAGTLLLIPALQSGHYALVLGAFFIIGLGFNFELVAGNPLLSGLGPPESSASRLNLGNALGAIAQIIAPFILTLIIPATTVTVAGKLPYMKGLFLALGGMLLVTMLTTMIARGVDITASLAAHETTPTASEPDRTIWLRPRVVFGFATIFLVLGAEAGLFGLFRNFVEDPAVAGKSSRSSQQLFTVYFAVFALGRLAGSWTQKRVRPAFTLAIHSAAALALVGVLMVSKGNMAIGSLMLLGFFVSIFFPTLYSLAIEGLGSQTAKASGLLTMGFLGCAFLPVLQGRLADSIGLQRSFGLCFIPYLLALCYALSVIKSARNAQRIGAQGQLATNPAG
ncbi:MAG TPA: MFS transporter [Verrucomicrobiae bacterium]|nr:MFS transporter [Verrucomicrobiae bacterium]